MAIKDPMQAIKFTKERFIPLVKDFLESKISDADYEQKMIDAGYENKYYFNDVHMDLICFLTGDAQMYYAKDKSISDISEEQLRANCAKYLAQLEKIVADYEAENS